jgi:hypothetical protein
MFGLLGADSVIVGVVSGDGSESIRETKEIFSNCVEPEAWSEGEDAMLSIWST